MRKYLPNIDLYKYEYDYDDEYLDEPILIDLEDFKYIKSVIRTTKDVNLPTHKRALVDLMTLYATHIFSKDMIKSLKVQKKINGKNVTSFSRKFNDELFNKHVSLFKIYLEKSNNVNNICRVIQNRYYNDIADDTTDYIKDTNDIIQYYNREADDERCKIENKTENNTEKTKKSISLKQKILTYQHIEVITNIEEVKYFKQIYNDVINCTFTEKRNILKEYVSKTV